MTRAARIRAGGLTDKGRVREANEDAFLVGDSVFAVADGMGGHLAGEVASATALEPVRALDGRVFPESSDAIEALRAAVVEANTTVSQMAEDEPSQRGMGTTLTVALVEGRRLHVGHVGDSRAYLLRGASFDQLTDDHTLVQHLIDEGQITREEAATHPQRSIITRAIGVSRDIDVDSLSIELEQGDQLLLCSDGLTGVVDDATIATELDAGRDLDTTLQRLVDLALEGGGPDNITAILLRYGDPPDVAGGADDATAAATSASAPVRVTTRDDRGEQDWADRLGSYGALARGGPVASDDGSRERGRGRIVGRIAAVLVGTAVVAGLLFGGGRFLLGQQYFVGFDEDQVVIYRGIDASVGPFDLASVAERTEVTRDEIVPWYQTRLDNGITAADLADARRIAENAPRRDADGEGPDATDPDAPDVPADGDEPADGADGAAVEDEA
ncbi:Stp1/IreP family PP2C-type Ser/Thr phosphatase [Nitriliruptoraceae bacterium ZYF776]|nr:Stp1/IreP family PP2C-type Ser/Thr phosphatase [Profundirhabdus halotolerans]